MVVRNYNYIETSDGDIMPNYASGHGNQPHYAHIDTEQPDFFHVDVGEGVDERDENSVEVNEEVHEIEATYADAIASGIARAEAFMNNPDEHGYDWPTAKLNRAHKSRILEMPGRNRGNVSTFDQPVTPAEVLKGKTPEEVSRQSTIYHAGAAAARQALKGS